MKKVQYAGEQLKIEIDQPQRVRDVKGYVQMVKAQRGESVKKNIPPQSVTEGAACKNKERREEEYKQMMFDFVKLTLPAKNAYYS